MYPVQTQGEQTLKKKIVIIRRTINQLPNMYLRGKINYYYYYYY